LGFALSASPVGRTATAVNCGYASALCRFERSTTLPGHFADDPKGWPAQDVPLLHESVLEGLLKTQLRSALDGHFESGDRITLLATVVDGHRELDSDDLLRVSGFLAGLRASKSEPPSV
jgi:hypothetical protein